MQHSIFGLIRLNLQKRLARILGHSVNQTNHTNNITRLKQKCFKHRKKIY